MRKLSIAALAAAFGASATFGILLGGAQTPAQAHPALLSAAATIAAADENENENDNGEVESGANAGVQVADRDENENDNEDGNHHERAKHGDKDCVNPAGHRRGWCKHGDRDGNRDSRTISGTVTGINGNLVNFQLDNGQTITVLDNNGTQLNVGQHYRLRGHYQNGQFVLGGNGYNNGNNNNQSVSGNIVAVGNGTVTLLGVPPVTINVQQAINNNATNGSLSIGRHITAYGYYSNNIFYATSIQ